MRIKSCFSLKRENGQNIVVSNTHIANTITLSESAAFLFDSLKESERSKEELLNLLLDNFNISTVLALNDIDIFVKIMKENGILDE